MRRFVVYVSTHFGFSLADPSQGGRHQHPSMAIRLAGQQLLRALVSTCIPQHAVPCICPVVVSSTMPLRNNWWRYAAQAPQLVACPG